MPLAFQPSFPSDRDLANDPRLQSDYVFQHLQLPKPDGRLVADDPELRSQLRALGYLVGKDAPLSPSGASPE